jgi:ubiquinone/menaquinone biosynthesis C-methylase UbiE
MESLRKIYYALSPSLRLAARKAFYFPIDQWETITGKRHKYQPPRGDIYTGSGDFIQQGNLQSSHLLNHSHIQAHHRVLDIGSGIGRTAVGLTSFLSAEGSYEGFDVVEKGVRWCQQKISIDFPNFQFQYVPLHNDLYNSNETSALGFKFPYTNQEFDTAFLFSVFTHMAADEIGHYLTEIHRVLKPEGQCLFTCFLYDTELESTISKRASFNFPYKGEGYRLMDRKVTAANIALEETYLQKMVAQAGLQIKTIIPGHWRDQSMINKVKEFQDIVVLTKS